MPDSTQAEIRRRVKGILRAFLTDDYQSEAYHMHQRYAKMRCQMIKQRTSTSLNRTGAPSCE